MVQIEPECRTDLERDRPFGEGADTQLRTLQIEQNADGPAPLFLDAANGLHAGRMVFVQAVTEVQPKDVCPGIEQLLDHTDIGAGGTERGDYFGFTGTAHTDSLDMYSAWAA